MIGGFIIGIIRFALEFGFKPPPCGSLNEDTRPKIVIDLVDNFHFLHFGGFSFAFTCLLAFVFVYLTPPMDQTKVSPLNLFLKCVRLNQTC